MTMAHANQRSVAREIEMRILLADGGSLPLQCALSYSVSDPYAVTAAFRSGDGVVSWVFARELLLDAMAGPVGEGDIRLSVHEGVLRMQLSSPAGEATMEGPIAAVRDFLEASLGLLPLGYEWQYMNFDTELAEILDGGF